jgi:protocatechuate 3,4-dioxygenase beta subunit
MQAHKLLIALTCAVGLLGQTPVPEERPAIRGEVRSATTGEPLAKATLLLTPLQGPDTWVRSYGGTSDSSGKFEIRDIKPGKYRLRTSRKGFVPAEYGARAPGRPGETLVLESPSPGKPLEILLQPHAVISGRVLDADGEPLERAQVQLLQSRYMNGRKVLSTSATTHTNDLGDFRWSGLVAGRYYLYVASLESTPPGSISTEEYMPAYYPDTIDSASATPFDVGAGAHIRVPDLVLRKARTVTIRGRVAVEIGGATGPPAVRLSVRNGHDDSGAHSHRILPAAFLTPGEFEIRNVPPGSYTATAEVPKGGRSFVGTIPVVVAGNPIEELVITIPNPVSIHGRIRGNGDEPVELKNAEVVLRNGGAGTSTGGEIESHPASPDGTFRIENLNPGRFGIWAGRLCAACYTKSVLAGGIDVTYTGIELRSGPPGPIEIRVSAKGGTIAGQVSPGKPGTSAARATVVLIPKEKNKRDLAVLYQVAQSDSRGNFSFHGIPPGEYKVFAWEDVEPGAWLNAEFLEPVEETASSIEVAESGQCSVHVNLIPARYTVAGQGAGTP